MTALNSLLSLLLASNVTFLSPANEIDVTHVRTNADVFESSPKNDPEQPLFLTPYIENRDIERARFLSKVGKLPNSPDVPSYSGLLTVNKQHDSNMFFWFFPALNNDTKAPVILWLQGGPGASDLLGLYVLHGPYIIRKNLTVELRSHTWAKEFNVIYVDNPVGTGFSFTNHDDGYSKDQDHVADNLYEFLQQFFKVFHEYASNDLYVIGESYGGKYAPAIAYKIHVAGPPAQIKFKGIGIGNGLSDPETQMNYSDYYYQLGLIDRKQAEIIRNAAEKAVQHIRYGSYVQAREQFNNIVQDVPQEAHPNYLLQFAGYNYAYNFLQTEEPEDHSYYKKYAELPEFRNAIHVGNLTLNQPDKVRQFLIPDVMKSVKQKLVTIMNNYKVLIYNGQLDLTLPYVLMVDFLSKVEWKLSDEYKNADRKIWRLDGKDEVAGYVHNVGDFYHVLVRSAGHMVPYEQPELD
ncbi:putative serine carboxypeptidase CPVL like protein [Argiope bruennichi]|uniref:Carboxypeptidase n=1 Tax=Argiope bruennichi TaxID=94029 RepID=A0A8T0E5A0_ARGBR|nr:putative serine carboxypeptidase CPVL like protein [Argiope bruennichi]